MTPPSAPRRRRPGLRLLGLLSLLSLLLALQAVAAIHIPRPDITQTESRLTLRGQLALNLPAPALEALDHGVPLTLRLYTELLSPPSWLAADWAAHWWPTAWWHSLDKGEMRVQLRYQPLAELYVITREPEPLERPAQPGSFVGRSSALSAFGQIPALDLNLPGTDARGPWRVRLRATLDLEALPLPLRIRAYLDPAWQLDSGWQTWPEPS